MLYFPRNWAWHPGRKNDHENFLCCLLLSGAVQRAAFALRAFNIELAQVRDTVTDGNRGLMKMQFWKDGIEQIYRKTPPQTPVAIELAGAVQFFKLSKRWLTRIITERADHLHDKPFRDLKHVEEYGENTNSSLNYLLLQCQGIQNVHADHAGSHIGKTQGLVTLLRSTPYHASKQRVHLPIELLLKHKVSQEDVIRKQNLTQLQDVVYDVACTAQKHLQTARSLKKDVPKDAYLVFLSTVICDWYLKKLEQVGFDVFHVKLQHKNSMLPYHLWLQKIKKTY
ncbi:NADH dehydrogenase (ubiquinone) complex I, assembly factor 6-like isoform X2 [Gigantopelta aegis]|uniref:NADH dehydrogenase (ubiquinone) complex I, assembly factor 6-like isoform X2 n=1 Tax=Gigantopelta aegis TaxID=1735272 RepID=UPI001B88B5A7|nr:NADH dehydrogenase (ubiquinone) complex I, assembly factor 6-like isoform X2 [Gigantopelta aegis]